MRRIKKARIRFLSLCPKGANKFPTIFKDDGAFELSTLTKAGSDFDERGELLAVVYAPEVRDAQGDIASAEVIKDAMYEAAKDGEQIDIRHDGKPVPRSSAYVAERFIVQKGDERFADFKDYDGNPVDVTGAWAAVLKIDDPELRKLYREGKWQGVSMGGQAEMVSERPDSLDGFLNKLAKALGFSGSSNTNTSKSQGDIDMTGDELKTALKENNAALATSIVDGIKKAIKPDEDYDGDDKDKGKQKKKPKADAPKDPVFKGDATNADDLAEHQKALELFELQKDVDWSDRDSVKEYQDKLAKWQEEHGDDNGDGDANNDTPDSVAGTTVTKASRNTSAPKSQTQTQLQKQEAAIEEMAKEMAGYANEGLVLAKSGS